MKTLQVNRIAWAVFGLLVAGTIAGVAVLSTCLVPYWIAKHDGFGADLQDAVLMHAPLRGANLMGANLRGADLRGADLRNAWLGGAKLSDADLREADLRGAGLGGGCIQMADLSRADLRGTDLRGTGLTSFGRHGERQTVCLTGARFDARTRWPVGFNAQEHGAVIAGYGSIDRSYSEGAKPIGRNPGWEEAWRLEGAGE